MATSLVVSPDASPETSSVDGYLETVGVEDTLATLRAGGGATADDSGASMSCRLEAGSTTDRFNSMQIAYFLFDFSAIPSNAYITAATLRLYCTSKQGDWDATPYVTNAEPASDTALAGTDFDYTVWDTLSYFSSVPVPSSWTTSAYNSLSANTTGLAYLNAAIAIDGIARFGIAFPSFVDGTAHGTWSSGYVDQLTFDTADGTNAPDLTLTYVLSEVVNETLSMSEAIVNLFPTSEIINEALNMVENVIPAPGMIVNETLNMVESIVSYPLVPIVINETLNMAEGVVSSLSDVIAKIIRTTIRGTRIFNSFIKRD